MGIGLWPRHRQRSDGNRTIQSHLFYHHTALARSPRSEGLEVNSPRADGQWRVQSSSQRLRHPISTSSEEPDEWSNRPHTRSSTACNRKLGEPPSPETGTRET